jgi:hypothetical protein
MRAVTQGERARERTNAYISSEQQRADASAPAIPWPTLDPDASHGIAGEYVNAIKNDTEADPAALLVQFLVNFGALVGRNADGNGPHVRVEGSRHYANLFALLVGETSKGRKGTSLARARAPFNLIEDGPGPVTGLTSGEGLKYHVRDDSENRNGERVPGVADKRLLVVESEFAQVLATASRPGVTLSPTIREAWDSGNLKTLTRNDPITATNAHVSIIAHITAEELHALLSDADRANGFANRFLFICTRRARRLPFGGAGTPDSVIAKYAERIAKAAATARTRGVMEMDERAREVWAETYEALSEGNDGLLGMVTARAEAQVLRLSLVYALLDSSPVIREVHLCAALAMWAYAEDSARYVFRQMTGAPIADKILAALRGAGEAGFTITEIHAVLGRNEPAENVKKALDLLDHKGLAIGDRQATGRGRPTERWWARATNKRINELDGQAEGRPNYFVNSSIRAPRSPMREP